MSRATWNAQPSRSKLKAIDVRYVRVSRQVVSSGSRRKSQHAHVPTRLKAESYLAMLQTGIERWEMLPRQGKHELSSSLKLPVVAKTRRMTASSRKVLYPEPYALSDV